MMTKKFKILTDKSLLEMIRSKIKWDKRVSTSDLVITSKGGHITVDGVVDGPYKKQAILEIISSTPGVLKVDNLVIVPAEFHRSDLRIKSMIIEQLLTMELEFNESISVDVKNGCVTLSGVVHHLRKKADASGMVWELSGVSDCNNVIKIRGAPPRPSISSMSRPDMYYLNSEVFEKISSTIH